MERGTTKFSVLGPFAVSADDAVVDIGGAKQQLVLLTLVMAENRVVSTDRLIDIVWGDNPPAKPNVTLRSYISHLRKVLDPSSDAGDRRRLLVTRSPGYALEIEDTQVDARRFNSAAQQARSAARAGDDEVAIATAETAMAEWHSEDISVVGDAFPGDARSLLETRNEVRAIWHEAHLRLGRHDEVLPSLQAAAAETPANERIRLQLMSALYRSGRASEAIEQGANFRDHLINSGLEPTEALSSLEVKILNNDPTLDVSAPAATTEQASSSQSSSLATDRARGSAPIGRAEPFDAAVAALDLNAPSRSRLHALVGEPGIGKTTLLNAIAGHAASVGQRVVWGRCHDGGQANTLWPWTSMLRDLTEGLDRDDLTAALGHRAGELAVLLPELQERVDVEPKTSNDLLGMFDALGRVIRHLSADRPIVAIIEDAHWADPASIKALEVLLPLWQASPVTVFASWRDTETIDDELASALAALGRHDSFRRSELTGLDAASLQLLHHELRGSEASDEDIAGMLERTRGNPLFASELIRHGTDGSLSTSLRDAIAERIAQLPDNGAELLTIGALGRDGFSTEILQAGASQSHEEVLDTIELAMNARLIEAHPDASQRFHFTHALVQEVLRSQLSDVRRATLHARIGHSLSEHDNAEQKPSDELLAHHFLQGHGTELLGATHSLVAAESSSRLQDHRSAKELLSTALDTLDAHTARGQGSVEFETVRASVMTGLGQQLKHTHEIERVHSLVTEAFELADAMGLLKEMAIATLVYTGSTKVSGRFPHESSWLAYWAPPGPAIAMVERCLERLPADDPFRPFLTAELGSSFFGERADPDRASRLVYEGVELAKQRNNKPLLTGTLQVCLQTVDRWSSVDQRTKLALDLRDAARASDLLQQESVANRALALVALDTFDLEEFHARIAEIDQITSRVPNSTSRMEAKMLPISWALFLGEVDQAEQLLNQAFAEYGTFGEATLDTFGIQLLMLNQQRGNHEWVTEVMRPMVERYPGPAYSAPYSLSLANRGDLVGAREALADYDPEIIAEGGEGVLQFMTPFHYAEIIRVIGDADLVEVCLEGLQGARNRMITMNNGQLFFGSGSLTMAHLNIMIGRLDEAEELLSEAFEAHTRLAARPSILRNHLGFAELSVARGGDPTPHLNRAHELADELQLLHWEIELVEARIGKI